MCIIIYYSDSVHSAFVFKASVGASECGQRFPDDIVVNTKKSGGCNGGRGIVNIIQARYAQGIGYCFLVRPFQIERRMAKFVIGDI